MRRRSRKLDTARLMITSEDGKTKERQMGRGHRRGRKNGENGSLVVNFFILFLAVFSVGKVHLHCSLPRALHTLCPGLLK